MGVKKGDLVKVALPKVSEMSQADVQQELFFSLSKLEDSDLLIVTTSPYEHQKPVISETPTRGRLFLYNSLIVCVDLMKDGEIYKAVPIKFLKRA